MSDTISKQALVDKLNTVALQLQNEGAIVPSGILVIVRDEIESGAFDTDQGEVQRLRAALEKAKEELRWGDAENAIDRVEKIIVEALSTTTGVDRCPEHPEARIESSSSHTYTQDGNTYFKSQVKYCSTCYHVINTDAWL